MTWSGLEWGTLSETAGIVGHPLRRFRIDQQLTRCGVHGDLAHLANDSLSRGGKHDRHGPTQSLADLQLRSLAEQLRADLPDHKPRHLLPGDICRDIHLRSDLDVDG